MTKVQAITNTSPQGGDASSMAASPDWIHTYFRELAHHTEKARAAQAAGQTLPEIARRRLHDPAFAEEEAILLEAFADYLESEAIRRCCDRSYTEACKKPLGSDTLLIRLLNLFHPKFTGLRAIQQSLSRSTPTTNQRRSTNRPPLPDEEGKFRSRAHLVAFREWERHQAIALALDLLTQPPVAPASASHSHSAQTTESATTSAPNGAVETQRSGDRQVTAIFSTSSEVTPLTANPEPTCSSPSREIPFNPVNPVQKEHRPSSVTASVSSQSTSSTESTRAAALWSRVESAIAQLRADRKRLQRQGYSKNSRAIAAVDFHLAKCEQAKVELRPHLPANFLTTPTPDPDPPP